MSSFPFIWFLDIISMTSRKWVARFEVVRRGFSSTSNSNPRANWHENMSCFDDGQAFISVGWKPCTTKHEPQNLPPIETCQVSTSGLTYVSMPKPPKHIPIEKCNVSGAMFQPMCPSSMFPHVIPIHAPWPIHEVLDLFQLHIITMYFSIELWHLHCCSPTKYLFRVLITILGTNSIIISPYCGFLMFVGRYWFLYYFWQLAYVVSKVEKLHTEYLFTKRTSLLLLLCSFLALFVWVCVVIFFVIVFLFFICSFPGCCLGSNFFLFL
jgi:hypothetical protein